MKRQKSIWIVSMVIVILLIGLSYCTTPKEKPDPRGTAYALDLTCRTCHQAIYDSAVLSGHYLASGDGNNHADHYIQPGASFVYDALTRVSVEKRDSGYFQVLWQDGKEIQARPFDIRFGMRHALTWLYWQEDRAFELPLSFYKEANGWGTSPGFSATQPNYNRLIGKDCFECHSSYIATQENAAITGDYFASDAEIERLDKNTLINGIDCQRCHGPAAQHVDFHQANPNLKEAKYIVSHASLNTQQQLDQCAVCHGGNDQTKLKSRFQFKPGDRLDDYFITKSAPSGELDVHGNQYHLLNQSACFLGTKTMTCTTCHNPHNPVNQNLIAYSKQCMSCHTETGDHFCSFKPTNGIRLQDNCIDCHMPNQASNAVQFQLSGQKEVSAYTLRTHKIGVYEMERR